MSQEARHRKDPSPGTPRRFLPLLGSGVRLTWQADRRGFLVASLLQVLGALSPVVLVVVGQYLIRRLTTGQRPAVGDLVAPVVLFAVVTVLTSAAFVLQQQQQRLLGERVATRAWERVLDVTGRVPLERFESSAFFDQLQRVRNNALSQPVGVTSSIFGLVGGTVGVVSLLVVLATIQPLLLPLLLVAGVPSVLISRRVSRLEFGFLVRATPLYRLRQYLRDLLAGRNEAKEIRVFGSEPALRRRHLDRVRDYDVAMKDHVRRRQTYALLDVVVTGVLLAATLGVLVWLVTTDRMSIADAGAAVLAVRFLSTGIEQLFRSVGQLFEASMYLSDLDAFLALGAEVDPPARGEGPALREAIEVHGVSFGYPESAATVLHDVDLRIGAGQVVALVGENGSGKTTLAKLVAGLYRPTGGSIRWDGVDVETIGAADVRRQVAAIFQDFVRYQLSALDNVGLGDPDHAEDLDAARAAARAAGADGYLDRLPARYDTLLSKEFAGGVDLSTGQWQRVALARALRKPAALVVLDEPTASLDPRTEAELFADLRTTLRGRSALLISHRFSSVRLADHIYVLRDGRIVESGAHDDLVARGGLYAELFRLQADAYL